MSKFSRGFLNAATAVSGLELDDSLISAAELYNTDTYFFPYYEYDLFQVEKSANSLS